MYHDGLLRGCQHQALCRQFNSDHMCFEYAILPTILWLLACMLILQAVQRSQASKPIREAQSASCHVIYWGSGHWVLHTDMDRIKSGAASESDSWRQCSSRPFPCRYGKIETKEAHWWSRNNATLGLRRASSNYIMDSRLISKHRPDGWLKYWPHWAIKALF